MTKMPLLTLMFFISFLTYAEEKQIEVQKETSKEKIKLSKHISSITPAKRTKKVSPKYPIQPARDGAEGWVRLSFVIDTNGDVQDILVMESGGSGHFARKDFIKQSKLAIEQWEYTPAKNQQGDNIASCKNSVQMDFRMTAKEYHDNFLDLLDLSFRSIDAKDNDKLNELIAKIEGIKEKTINEFAWTHYIKMKYFSLINDSENTYIELEKSHYFINVKDPSFTEPASLDILQNLLIMQVEKQLYSNARDTFNTLKQFDSELAQKLQAYYQPFITQIDQLVASDKNILVKGKVSDSYWYHHLVRNKFSISNVEGTLSEVEVRCDNKYSTFTVEQDNAWKVPKEWGACSIFVKGDSDASFDVYELPEVI